MNARNTAFTIFVFFIFIVIADGLFSKPGSQAVDLVKHKKQEEERKKKEKKSKYVVTNENLDKIEVPKKPYGFMKMEDKDESKKTLEDQSPTPAGEAAAEQAGKSGGEAGPAAATQRDKREYWQDQKRNLLIQINDLKVAIDKNQKELNQKEFQWSAIDDVAKSNKWKERVKELKKLIPEQQKELETLEKKLEELEDSARKEGIPPGWLRIDNLEEEPPAGKEKEEKKAVSKG